MQLTDEKIKKSHRKYFSADLDVTSWDNVKQELEELKNMAINSKNDLIKFMEKGGELSDILMEEMAWRYINMTRFADKEEYAKKYNSFFENIISKVQPYNHEFDKKFYNSPYRKELEQEKYKLLNKIIANDIELFRKENIPLQVKERKLANKYGSTYSKMTVEYDGEEKTLSQLGVYMKEQDRKVREEVWKLRMNRMQQEREKLNQLFNELKEVRIKQAHNAGFDNYRDYMHKSKGRFSYTPADLEKFHKSVEKVVVPFLKELTEERKEKLGIDSIRPWDTSVSVDGKKLKPFEDTDKLLDGSIAILKSVKEKFGINLNKMKNTKLLDLENRKGKAPGGYNYPLRETKAPFIFMNAVGIHRNVTTLLHESGHAMHTFAMKDLKINAFKSLPSEVAELASMSMEFLSMPYWDVFYQDEADLKKAKREQLESAVKMLPWFMIVDAFQHWIYLNPEHTVEEREEYFLSLLERFDTGVNWDGLEKYKKLNWLFQLHIFEVPFYYIEYGISQLGALSIYRNYKKLGKKEALKKYENFLKLGYTKPVDKIYETAGINFDFSEKNITELVNFVKEELAALE